MFCRILSSKNINEATNFAGEEGRNTYGLIKGECMNSPWSEDLSKTPPFTFIQLYDYLVIRSVKYKHILLKDTQYKRLKAFKYFKEGFIKKIEFASTENFVYLDVKMKASMKNKLYKVVIKAMFIKW